MIANSLATSVTVIVSYLNAARYVLLSGQDQVGYRSNFYDTRYQIAVSTVIH